MFFNFTFTPFPLFVAFKRSDVADKKPTAEQLDYGEIAINYAKDSEAIFFKNSENNVVEVKTTSAVVEELNAKQDKTDNALATTAKTVTEAINEINAKVGNLTGALVWKGKFDTLPAVTDYEAGNVVGVGNKEYVLTVTENTKTWEELGDEGSYLLKSTAEETYLKKSDGEVKTANLANGAVTSTKLAAGAQNPIIIGNVTEIDEETYQKIKSRSVDVVFDDGSQLRLNAQSILDIGDSLLLTFGYYTFSEDANGGIASYAAMINNTAPHKIVFGVGYNSPLNKDTFTKAINEIDLRGTDAERKAELDQFMKDWGAFTADSGNSNVRGARFVCRITTPTGDGYAILVYDSAKGAYIGVVTDNAYKSYIVRIAESTGSITMKSIGDNTEIDTSMSDTSTNPVQNKVIKAYIDGLVGNVAAQLAQI